MTKAAFSMTVFSLLLALSLPALADIKSDMTKGLPLGRVLGNAIGNEPTDKLVKATVKSMVENGANVDQLIKVALSLGYDPCPVVEGAISGGGDVTAVVQAAMTEGLDSDSLSVCCQGAGATPELVASAIADYNAGRYIFGYTTPGSGASAGDPSASAIPSGGLGGGGTDVSPRR